MLTSTVRFILLTIAVAVNDVSCPAAESIAGQHQRWKRSSDDDDHPGAVRLYNLKIVKQVERLDPEIRRMIKFFEYDNDGWKEVRDGQLKQPSKKYMDILTENIRDMNVGDHAKTTEDQEEAPGKARDPKEKPLTTIRIKSALPAKSRWPVKRNVATFIYFKEDDHWICNETNQEANHKAMKLINEVMCNEPEDGEVVKMIFDYFAGPEVKQPMEFRSVQRESGKELSEEELRVLKKATEARAKKEAEKGKDWSFPKSAFRRKSADGQTTTGRLADEETTAENDHKMPTTTESEHKTTTEGDEPKKREPTEEPDKDREKRRTDPDDEETTTTTRVTTTKPTTTKPKTTEDDAWVIVDADKPKKKPWMTTVRATKAKKTTKPTTRRTTKTKMTTKKRKEPERESNEQPKRKDKPDKRKDKGKDKEKDKNRDKDKDKDKKREKDKDKGRDRNKEDGEKPDSDRPSERTKRKDDDKKKPEKESDRDEEPKRSKRTTSEPMGRAIRRPTVGTTTTTESSDEPALTTAMRTETTTNDMGHDPFFSDDDDDEDYDDEDDEDDDDDDEDDDDDDEDDEDDGEGDDSKLKPKDKEGNLKKGKTGKDKSLRSSKRRKDGKRRRNRKKKKRRRRKKKGRKRRRKNRKRRGKKRRDRDRKDRREPRDEEKDRGRRDGDKERDGRDSFREKDSRDKEADRDKDWDKEKDRDRDKDKERDQDKDRRSERDPDKDKEKEETKDKDKDKEDRERDKEKIKGKDSGNDDEGDRKNKDNDREKDKNYERSADKDNERDRKDREKDREKNKDKDRDRNKEKDRENKDKDKEKNKDKDKDRSRDNKDSKDENRGKKDSPPKSTDKKKTSRTTTLRTMPKTAVSMTRTTSKARDPFLENSTRRTRGEMTTRVAKRATTTRSRRMDRPKTTDHAQKLKSGGGQKKSKKGKKKSDVDIDRFKHEDSDVKTIGKITKTTGSKSKSKKTGKTTICPPTIEDYDDIDKTTQINTGRRRTTRHPNMREWLKTLDPWPFEDEATASPTFIDEATPRKPKTTTPEETTIRTTEEDDDIDMTTTSTTTTIKPIDCDVMCKAYDKCMNESIARLERQEVTIDDCFCCKDLFEASLFCSEKLQAPTYLWSMVMNRLLNAINRTDLNDSIQYDKKDIEQTTVDGLTYKFRTVNGQKVWVNDDGSEASDELKKPPEKRDQFKVKKKNGRVYRFVKEQDSRRVFVDKEGFVFNPKRYRDIEQKDKDWRFVVLRGTRYYYDGNGNPFESASGGG